MTSLVSRRTRAGKNAIPLPLEFAPTGTAQRGDRAVGGAQEKTGGWVFTVLCPENLMASHNSPDRTGTSHHVLGVLRAETNVRFASL
jgi:hypothetical protein